MTTGSTGEINERTVVETFVNTVYATGGIGFASQKLGFVSEAYPLPPLIGGLGGTLTLHSQVIAAHGMVSSGGTVVGVPNPSVGTMAGSVVATIAATLAPNVFLAKVYQAPAGTLVEAPAGTITAALTFLLKGR